MSDKRERILYVTDLDGTLLNTKDTVSPYSIEIINRLAGRGMLFTYATARSLVSASVVTKGLSANIPVIAYNGAFIFRPDTGEILSSVTFSGEEIRTVVDFMIEKGIFPLVYAYVDGIEKVSWVTSRENDGIRRYLSNRRGDKRLRPLADGNGLYDGDIFYFTCIGEKEELWPVYERFKEDGHYNCTLQQELYRPEYFCEIMPRQATKANAIVKLKEMWHCDKVVSFGDAINDLPMFAISDECYAVENAVDELKKVAAGIIDSNDKDGVARWLLQNARLDIGKGGCGTFNRKEDERMELWDIYDSNQKRTGRTMKRNDFHLKEGEYHLTVLGVIARPDGKYLITQRVMTKAWAPGWWEVSGGAAQAGENSKDAVVREIREETGLDVTGAEGGYLFTYHRENPGEGDNYFVDVYKFVMDFKESDVKIQKEEAESFQLATPDEIRALAAQGIFLHYDSIRQAFT